MTEVARIADSTMFKLVAPIVQTIIGLGSIAAFGYVTSSLNSLQTQLSSYQTSQAVLIQRVDSLERQASSSEKLVDNNRMTIQGIVYKIDTMQDTLKTLVLNGRPK